MTVRGLRKCALILALVLLLQISPLRAQGIIAGQNVSAPGPYSSAFGVNTTGAAYASTAFGVGTTATNNAATAFGLHSFASGYVSTASGAYTQATEMFSTAWGNNTVSSGNESTAFGNQTTASGYASTAFGYGSAAIGSVSTAFGYISEAYGWASVAGNQATAFGNRSVAFGFSAAASGTASSAFGWNTQANGNCSTASGYVTFADSLDSVAFGAFNVRGGDSYNWVPTDPLFQIGNGYPGYSSDALVVYKNGNTVITGSDNELPNQVLIGAHSILTEALGDGRYMLGSTIFQVGNGGASKASVESTDNSYGEFQVANPTSNGEASIGFISGATELGDSPSSTNGIGNIWAIGPDVAGIGGSTFGIVNKAYNASIFNVTSGGNVGIGTSSPESILTVENDQYGARGGELSLVNYSGGAGAEAAINFGVDPSTYNADNGNAQIKARNINATGNNDTAIIFSTWNGSSFGERMRMAPGGNLGVGTTTPQAKLDVAGSTYMRGTVIITGTLVSGTVVASGSNLVLIPQQGDLSMGQFTAGATPQ